MTATQPNLREVLNHGKLGSLDAIMSQIGFGDLLAALIQKCLDGGRVQAGHFTATGASQALTFAGLGMVPPASADYEVFASCETTNCRVDESTKTTTGFTLLGTTNTEVINVVIVERDGPAWSRVTVTSNAGTLAAAPLAVLDVIAVDGTSLGRKALKIGDSTVVPAAGEVVWDGNTSLRFNATDAVTLARVASFPKASPLVTSLLNRQVMQKDV